MRKMGTVKLHTARSNKSRVGGVTLWGGFYFFSKFYFDWKKVKNRRMKDNLITNYCLAMKKKHKLKYKETKQLYDLIKDSLFELGIQKSDDFEMKNGEIVKIQDIYFDKKTNQFVNKRFTNYTEDEKVKEKTNILHEKLDKLLDFDN
jgi:hypothetical protein